MTKSEELPEKCQMKPHGEPCNDQAIEWITCGDFPAELANDEAEAEGKGRPYEEVHHIACCTFHALQWKIGWLLGDYGIGIPPYLITEFLSRALAYASEEAHDRQV
jgi:hypothetical protein